MRALYSEIERLLDELDQLDVAAALINAPGSRQDDPAAEGPGRDAPRS